MSEWILQYCFGSTRIHSPKRIHILTINESNNEFHKIKTFKFIQQNYLITMTSDLSSKINTLKWINNSKDLSKYNKSKYVLLDLDENDKAKINDIMIQLHKIIGENYSTKNLFYNIDSIDEIYNYFKSL